MPDNFADKNSIIANKADKLNELRAIARRYQTATEAAVFGVQYAFNHEDLYENPGMAFNPVKFNRLIGATENLLENLNRWKHAESEIVVAISSSMTPKPDHPENDISPEQIAQKRLHHVEDTQGSDPSSDQTT